MFLHIPRKDKFSVFIIFYWNIMYFALVNLVLVLGYQRRSKARTLLQSTDLLSNVLRRTLYVRDICIRDKFSIPCRHSFWERSKVIWGQQWSMIENLVINLSRRYPVWLSSNLLCVLTNVHRNPIAFGRDRGQFWEKNFGKFVKI